jgi:hypothetical protein
MRALPPHVTARARKRARATRIKRVTPLEGARVTAEWRLRRRCSRHSSAVLEDVTRTGGGSDARQSDEQVEEEDRGTVGGAPER